jgi:hypothetical protein
MFPGNCSDNSGQLPGRYPDDSSDATRRLPGRCWNTARMNPSNCPALAAAFPPDNRRIAGGNNGLNLVRGWCLTKMNGFQIQKDARDSVRLNASK